MKEYNDNKAIKRINKVHKTLTKKFDAIDKEIEEVRRAETKTFWQAIFPDHEVTVDEHNISVYNPKSVIRATYSKEDK